MDRHNGFGAFGNLFFDGLRAEIEAYGVDIGKYRSRTHAGNRAACCKEGKRAGNDFIAGADFQGHQGQQEGIGT